MEAFRQIRHQRLAAERGTLFKQGDLSFALVYPSPYHVGMSSLGFQTIYRELNALPGVAAERAFLPDEAPRPGSRGPASSHRAAAEALATYESARPVGDFSVVAFSLAYEIELGGVVTCLDLAGSPRLRKNAPAHGAGNPWLSSAAR